MWGVRANTNTQRKCAQTRALNGSAMSKSRRLLLGLCCVVRFHGRSPALAEGVHREVAALDPATRVVFADSLEKFWEDLRPEAAEREAPERVEDEPGHVGERRRQRDGHVERERAPERRLRDERVADRRGRPLRGVPPEERRLAVPLYVGRGLKKRAKHARA